VVFGEAAEIILKAMQAATEQAVTEQAAGETASRPQIIHCANLRAAVTAAAKLVEPGDVVLLSPGGTSFDEFRDFEERGEWFARMVNELT
jgi:UDP-N-acetylmuramoylalanine--D-glutamate ligase